MMSEFLGMEGWDLQSVVRGYAINEASSSEALMDTSHPCFSPLAIQPDEFLFGFPDLFETTTVLDELEQLYKPFYPVLQPLSPTGTAAAPSISSEDRKKMEEQNHLAGSAHNGGGGGGAGNSHGAKPKKSRKGQQKRVVQHVTVEGLSSDVWAWRKYGQKPIKGSPYPRSYYRCSSLKGCLARKQVERSRTDPEIFIVTYTAEHSHSHPTRRNSLAGISRSKFSSTPKKLIKAEPPATLTTAANNFSSSPISTSDASATTPTISSMEDELQPYAGQPETGGEEDQKLNDRNKTNEIHISDEILNNDFFLGLEEIGFSVQFQSTFPQPWFAATAAGGY